MPTRSLFLAALFAAASIAMRVAPAAADDCIPIDTFASTRVGDFPADWKVRKDAGKTTYTVREEAGAKFLRAESKGLGLQAARSFEWNLDEYPILKWRWRPVEFPKGGDERESGKNDSVLAVYLLVPYSNIRGPQAVKYIWSEKAPVGTKLESNMGLTKVRVLRSGTDGKGEWKDERANARADFLEAFQPASTPKPAGIAVLTDADDTASLASGDYAGFEVCKN
jgi:hypothetical protein